MPKEGRVVKTLPSFFLSKKVTKPLKAPMYIVEGIMGQVWVELKYGIKGQGISLCRLDNPYLLLVFKRCALSRAKWLAEESEGVDEIIHFQDQAELERLEKLLDLLIPAEGMNNE